MRLPQILKKPIVMLHAVAWIAMAIYYGMAPFAKSLGLRGIYESLAFGVALYLFWGATAVASLPVCWLSLRRAWHAHDRALVAQAGIGSLLACSVLAYAVFLLTLIWSSPR